MPELRKDLITHRWVIIAKERARRPNEFQGTLVDQPPKFDPFAAGNEDKTPPEIYAIRKQGAAPNSQGWKVRVVPNKYPALGIEGTLDKRADGIYDHMHGVGAHEVIIETPETLRDISGLGEEHYALVLKTWRYRLLDLARDRRMAYGMLFKNVGSRAGATAFHSHSQLIATPIVPRLVKLKLDNAKAYHEFRGRSVFADMVRQEQDTGERVVLETDYFLVFEPYAPRFPFETWIFPRKHVSHYEHGSDTVLEELAYVLRQTVRRLEAGLGEFPYNLMLFSMPFRKPETEYFCWHIEIIPRLTQTAGFEWGTGFYINTVPPKEAAEYLRNLNP